MNFKVLILVTSFQSGNRILTHDAIPHLVLFRIILNHPHPHRDEHKKGSNMSTAANAKNNWVTTLGTRDFKTPIDKIEFGAVVQLNSLMMHDDPAKSCKPSKPDATRPKSHYCLPQISKADAPLPHAVSQLKYCVYDPNIELDNSKEAVYILPSQHPHQHKSSAFIRFPIVYWV